MWTPWKRNKVTEQEMQQKISGKEKYYSDKKFSEKLVKSKKSLSQKVLYAALLLFEALKSSKLPVKTRMTILGALGYLIFPVDALPDFLPVIGLTDDAVLILTALVSVYNAIDDNMRMAAEARMQRWLGDKYNAGQVNKQIRKLL